MRLKIIIPAVVLLLLLMACSQQQAGQPAEKIKIGFMGPLSGDAASYGIGPQKGAQLALKESGLTNIELVSEDSKCDGKEAVSAINKLISINGVKAIVGEICSGATLAATPVAEQSQVSMVSPASTSPKITTAGDYIFRTVPSDTLQGSFGAKLAYGKGYRKLAVLYSNEDYGAGFNGVLTASFKELGGEVAADEAFERGAVDLRAQLTKIKSKSPDVLFIITNAPDSAVAALKQTRELNIEAALMSGDGLYGSDIPKNAGAAAEGLTVSTVSSGSSGFAERFKAEYGESPGPFAAQGYDAMQAIIWAIKLGAKTSQEIKNNLYLVEFDGATGKIKFDENGEVSGNYETYTVKDGKFELVP